MSILWFDSIERIVGSGTNKAHRESLLFLLIPFLNLFDLVIFLLFPERFQQDLAGFAVENVDVERIAGGGFGFRIFLGVD